MEWPEYSNLTLALNNENPLCQNCVFITQPDVS